MPHFFISSNDIKNNLLTVSDADNYKHIARALRVRKGEKLLFIDENKMQYETIVLDVTNSTINADNFKAIYRSFNLYKE